MLVNTMASCYDLGTPSNMSINPNNNNTIGYFQRPTTTSIINESNNNMMYGASNNFAPFMRHSSKPGLSPEAKAQEACRIHKEAERQRRERINAHIATLRALLLPNLNKTDKASVLKEVVRQVRELKKATSQLTADQTDIDGFLLPGDVDEIKLRRHENDNTTFIASFCCEDRPELIMDLNTALRTVQGKLVKAEMSTIGGRTKTVLWVRSDPSGGGSGGGPEASLKKALRVVVDRPCSSSRMGYGLMYGRMHRPY